MPATAAERILNAAMREFAKYGFAGARVERIVSRADVSPRSLYYHFGSKRGLYDAVRERLSAQHFEDFVRGVTDEPLVDRLLANLDVAMTPRWQTWARLLMWEALDGGAGSAPYPDGTVPGDLLAIRAAQERGELDPDLDPHVLTLAFIAITFWPTMFPQSTKRLTARHAQGRAARGAQGPRPGARTRAQQGAEHGRSVHHVGDLHAGGRGRGLAHHGVLLGAEQRASPRRARGSSPRRG